MIFQSNSAYSKVEIVLEQDRFVPVTQNKCEIREAYGENSLGESNIGGIIAGLIWRQVRGGQERSRHSTACNSRGKYYKSTLLKRGKSADERSPSGCGEGVRKDEFVTL